MVFMPENAPWVVLAFMFVSFLIFVGVLGLAVALAIRKFRLLKIILMGMTGVVGCYLGLLLILSWRSQEVVLELGQPKYFCEIDCHLAYALVDVKTAEALGARGDQISAKGKFYVAKVKVWFDERTISPHRGNGSLTPNPRMVVVIDDQGRRYEESLAEEKALAQWPGLTIPLTQPLRPGESCTTMLIFDLPSDIKNPPLWITDADSISRLLLGHEKSFFHKKILFQL